MCMTMEQLDTVQRMPGASLAGGFATGAAATSGHGPAKPARKRRPARKPPAPRAAVIERASSPLAIPGVEILVDGVPYEAAAPPLATHTSGTLISPYCLLQPLRGCVNLGRYKLNVVKQPATAMQ